MRIESDIHGNSGDYLYFYHNNLHDALETAKRHNGDYLFGGSGMKQIWGEVHLVDDDGQTIEVIYSGEQ